MVGLAESPTLACCKVTPVRLSYRRVMRIRRTTHPRGARTVDMLSITSQIDIGLVIEN